MKEHNEYLLSPTASVLNRVSIRWWSKVEPVCLAVFICSFIFSFILTRDVSTATIIHAVITAILFTVFAAVMPLFINTIIAPYTPPPVGETKGHGMMPSNKTAPKPPRAKYEPNYRKRKADADLFEALYIFDLFQDDDDWPNI